MPTSISLSNLSEVHIDILRYPGATINSLTDRFSNINFWTRQYDGIILCIGGNDLTRLTVEQVFSRLRDLVRRLKPLTRFLTICTIEYRLYLLDNRYRVDQPTYRRKVVTINCKIKRFTRGIWCKNLDLGKRCFTLQRVQDGVHFTPRGRDSFCFHISRVIRACLQESQNSSEQVIRLKFRIGTRNCVYLD